MTNNSFPVATVLVCVLVAVAAVVGGAVVIWGHDGALSFKDYLSLLTKFAGAIGLVGIGRGIHFGLRERGAVNDTHLRRTRK
jgi:hypothetical protein